MSVRKSAGEIFKDIAVRAASEYIDKTPGNKGPRSTPAVAERCGIPLETFKRYIDPDKKGSMPNLLELMEFLKVANKREYLLEFAEQSKSEAAKFIKEYYAQYLNSHQIVASVAESEINEAAVNEEVLRLINEHQESIDSKMYRQWRVTVWVMLSFFLLSLVVMASYMKTLTNGISEMATEIDCVLSERK